MKKLSNYRLLSLYIFKLYSRYLIFNAVNERRSYYGPSILNLAVHGLGIPTVFFLGAITSMQFIQR